MGPTLEASAEAVKKEPFRFDPKEYAKELPMNRQQRREWARLAQKALTAKPVSGNRIVRV